jgi:hypothetical protein
MAIADLIARQAGAAIQAKQHFIALAEAVGDNIVAIDLNIKGFVGLAIVHHGGAPFYCQPSIVRRTKSGQRRALTPRLPCKTIADD